MATPDVIRIKSFGHRFARAQATEVVELAWGYAVLQANFPHSYVHNRIVVISESSAADLVATADTLLGGAGLKHRYVTVDDDSLGKALRSDLVAAGYEHERLVTMIYAGDLTTPPAHEVQEVSLESLMPALVRDWRVEIPDAPNEAIKQLADRTALYSRGAEVALLAVHEGQEIATHAALFVDPVEHIAQLENLVTHANFRGRGYGSSLVREALTRAQQAGCQLSFLEADLDDWPHEWYTRLGYVETCRTHNFTYSPST